MITALLLLILVFMLVFAVSGIALVIIALRRVPTRAVQHVAIPERTRQTRWLRHE
jgi:hypothetical protein